MERNQMLTQFISEIMLSFSLSAPSIASAPKLERAGYTKSTPLLPHYTDC